MANDGPARQDRARRRPPSPPNWRAVIPLTTAFVAAEVAAERAKQSKKWASRTTPTWHHNLSEEFEEAMAEDDVPALRAKLVQVAAVCVAWVEAIDRRGGAR